MACSPEEARKILWEASDILTSRRRAFDTKRTPYYLIIIADRSLLEASGEEFAPEDKALGLGVLYAYGELGDLPHGCQSVIMCGPSGEIHHSHTNSVTLFTPDMLEPGQPDRFSRFSRALAPIRLASKAELPKYVSFLQGFGVRTVNELNVIDRWKNNRYWSRTSVGPHGLIAGTAGSGMSELLTSWLLSMAVNYSTEDVNFMIIRFKGCSLSDILMLLPHVDGIVSNLDDPSNIDRYLRSLGGEIVRRMKLFKEASEKFFVPVNNLLDYQALQKIHKELPAIPYLIIIVDRTRSGYVYEFDHAIPSKVSSGVRFRNNITFTICLRTAASSDSKEIISTSDAFELKAPGRAIVKADGNSPIYEEVQTFCTKAHYSPDEKWKPSVGISFVELNGSRGRAESYRAKQNKPSEARAIVSYIASEALG